MKLFRISAFLLCLLMLCSVMACKKDETNTNMQDVSPVPPAQGEADAGGAGTAPDANPDVDPNDYMGIYGYPYGFTLHFSKDGCGFDTGSGTFFSGGLTASYDFSQNLAGMYHTINECNIYAIARDHADLTFAALSGGGTPPEDTVSYTITFTDHEDTYTVRTDSAALNTYYDNSNISNIKYVIFVLDGYVAQRSPL